MAFFVNAEQIVWDSAFTRNEGVPISREAMRICCIAIFYVAMSYNTDFNLHKKDYLGRYTVCVDF